MKKKRLLSKKILVCSYAGVIIISWCAHEYRIYLYFPFLYSCFALRTSSATHCERKIRNFFCSPTNLHSPLFICSLSKKFWEICIICLRCYTIHNQRQRFTLIDVSCSHPCELSNLLAHFSTFHGADCCLRCCSMFISSLQFASMHSHFVAIRNRYLPYHIFVFRAWSTNALAMQSRGNLRSLSISLNPVENNPRIYKLHNKYLIRSCIK